MSDHSNTEESDAFYLDIVIDTTRYIVDYYSKRQQPKAVIPMEVCFEITENKTDVVYLVFLVYDNLRAVELKASECKYRTIEGHAGVDVHRLQTTVLKYLGSLSRSTVDRCHERWARVSEQQKHDACKACIK